MRRSAVPHMSVQKIARSDLWSRHRGAVPDPSDIMVSYTICSTGYSLPHENNENSSFDPRKIQLHHFSFDPCDKDRSVNGTSTSTRLSIFSCMTLVPPHAPTRIPVFSLRYFVHSVIYTGTPLKFLWCILCYCMDFLVRVIFSPHYFVSTCMMHSALAGSRLPSLKGITSNHICQIAQADTSMSDDDSSIQDTGPLGPPRVDGSSSEDDSSSGDGSEIDDQMSR